MITSAAIARDVVLIFSAWDDREEIGSDLGKSILKILLCPLADRKHHNHRKHSDDHTKRGETGAELIGEEVSGGVFDLLREEHTKKYYDVMRPSRIWTTRSAMRAISGS